MKLKPTLVKQENGRYYSYNISEEHILMDVVGLAYTTKWENFFQEKGKKTCNQTESVLS